MKNSSGGAQFSIVDYIVFSSVLLLSSLIGMFYAWKARRAVDTRKFLVGNRDMGVIPITLSLIASLMSAITMLGMPAETFNHSTQYMLSVVSVFAAVVVADQIFLPMFYRLQLPSVNKYLQRRSGSNHIRLATTASYILGSFFYLGAVLYGPALALSSVTPIPIPISIILVGLVCTFYTTIGGMKAVVWTDVVQMTIMMAGLLMVAVKGVLQVGSFAEVIEINRRGDRIQFFRMVPDHEHGVISAWEIFLGMSMLWMGALSTNQISVQRYCCLRTLRKARISLYVTALGVSILVVLACFCGMVLYANYYDCNPLKLGYISKADQLMPYFVVESLGMYPGLPGLFVAAVFSGSLSTLSSVLNAMTTLTWDDFLKQHIKVGKTKEMWIIKSLGVFYGAATIGLAFVAQRVGSVMQASVSLAGAISGPLKGVFLMAAVCPFVSGKGMLIGLLTGQLCCLVINLASLIIEKPSRILPTSTSGCLLLNDTIISPMVSPLNQTLTTESPVEMAWAHYVSPYFIPFLGNLITIITGFTVSIVTGEARSKDIDPQYLSDVMKGPWRLPEWFTKRFCVGIKADDTKGNIKAADEKMNKKTTQEKSNTGSKNNQCTSKI